MGRGRPADELRRPVLRLLPQHGRALPPLDRELVTFRMFGKGRTLPHFWTLCDRCEQLYRAGDDEAILRLAVDEGGRPGDRLIDFDEQVRQPFDVFRRADLGPRELPPG